MARLPDAPASSVVNLRGDYSRAAADFRLAQNYDGYTADEQAIWRTLYERQLGMLSEHAAAEFIAGLRLLGADAHRIPVLEEASERLKRLTGFEVIGVPGLIQQVFEGAPRDARIVVVGVCMETDRSEPMLGIMKELNVQYVLGYTPEEFAYSLRLIAEGQVDAASMVTASVGIDGVAKAFADLANPEAHTKIIVEPWR